MKEALPRHFQKFVKAYPDVWEAHQKMSEACAACGPLDRKTRELIKVGIAGAALEETALPRHAVMALQEGAKKEEVYQAILMLITTVGFPRAFAALKWANQVFDGHGRAASDRDSDSTRGGGKEYDMPFIPTRSDVSGSTSEILCPNIVNYELSHQ